MSNFANFPPCFFSIFQFLVSRVLIEMVSILFFRQGTSLGQLQRRIPCWHRGPWQTRLLPWYPRLPRILLSLHETRKLPESYRGCAVSRRWSESTFTCWVPSLGQKHQIQQARPNWSKPLWTPYPGSERRRRDCQKLSAISRSTREKT